MKRTVGVLWLAAVGGLALSLQGVSDESVVRLEAEGENSSSEVGLRFPTLSDWRAAADSGEERSEEEALGVRYKVGSFLVVRRPAHEEVAKDLFGFWRQRLVDAADLQELEDIARDDVRKVAFFDEEVTDFSDIWEGRRERLIRELTIGTADRATDAVLNAASYRIRRLALVRNLEWDYTSALGGRRWQAGVAAVGALGESMDDATVWQWRAYAAQDSSRGGNFGVIYRYALANALLGLNVFLDYEQYGGADEREEFWRGSVGGEVKTSFLDVYANRYHAFTEGIRMESGDYLYSRGGYDVEIAFHDPDNRWLSGGVSHYRWFGRFGQEDDTGLRYHLRVLPLEDPWMFEVEVDSPRDGELDFGGRLTYARQLRLPPPTGTPLTPVEFDPRAYFYDVARREYGQRISHTGDGREGVEGRDVVVRALAGSAVAGAVEVAAGAAVTLFYAPGAGALAVVGRDVGGTVVVSAALGGWAVTLVGQSEVRWGDEWVRASVAAGTVRVVRAAGGGGQRLDDVRVGRLAVGFEEVGAVFELGRLAGGGAAAVVAMRGGAARLTLAARGDLSLRMFGGTLFVTEEEGVRVASCGSAVGFEAVGALGGFVGCAGAATVALAGEGTVRLAGVNAGGEDVTVTGADAEGRVAAAAGGTVALTTRWAAYPFVPRAGGAMALAGGGGGAVSAVVRFGEVAVWLMAGAEVRVAAASAERLALQVRRGRVRVTGGSGGGGVVDCGEAGAQAVRVVTGRDGREVRLGPLCGDAVRVTGDELLSARVGSMVTVVYAAAGAEAYSYRLTRVAGEAGGEELLKFARPEAVAAADGRVTLVLFGADEVTGVVYELEAAALGEGAAALAVGRLRIGVELVDSLRVAAGAARRATVLTEIAGYGGGAVGVPVLTIAVVGAVGTMSYAVAGGDAVLTAAAGGDGGDDVVVRLLGTVAAPATLSVRVVGVDAAVAGEGVAVTAWVVAVDPAAVVGRLAGGIVPRYRTALGVFATVVVGGGGFVDGADYGVDGGGFADGVRAFAAAPRRGGAGAAPGLGADGTGAGAATVHWRVEATLAAGAVAFTVTLSDGHNRTENAVVAATGRFVDPLRLVTAFYDAGRLAGEVDGAAGGELVAIATMAAVGGLARLAAAPFDGPYDFNAGLSVAPAALTAGVAAAAAPFVVRGGGGGVATLYYRNGAVASNARVTVRVRVEDAVGGAFGAAWFAASLSMFAPLGLARETAEETVHRGFAGVLYDMAAAGVAINGMPPYGYSVVGVAVVTGAAGAVLEAGAFAVGADGRVTLVTAQNAAPWVEVGEVTIAVRDAGGSAGREFVLRVRWVDEGLRFVAPAAGAEVTLRTTHVGAVTTAAAVWDGSGDVTVRYALGAVRPASLRANFAVGAVDGVVAVGTAVGVTGAVAVGVVARADGVAGVPSASLTVRAVFFAPVAFAPPALTVEVPIGRAGVGSVTVVAAMGAGGDVLGYDYELVGAVPATALARFALGGADGDELALTAFFAAPERVTVSVRATDRVFGDTATLAVAVNAVGFATVFSASHVTLAATVTSHFVGGVGRATAVGGDGNYSYRLDGAASAGGFVVGEDGGLSLTAANDGTVTRRYTAVVVASDGSGVSEAVRLTWVVAALARFGMAGDTVNALVSVAGTTLFVARAFGGSGAYGYALAAGSDLLANVDFDADSGVLSIATAFVAAVTGTVRVAAWDESPVVGTVTAAVVVRVFDGSRIVVTDYWPDVGAGEVRAVASVAVLSPDAAPSLFMDDSSHDAVQVSLNGAEIWVNNAAVGVISVRLAAEVTLPSKGTVYADWMYTVRAEGGDYVPQYVLRASALAGAVTVVADRFRGAFATVTVAGGGGSYIYSVHAAAGGADYAGYWAVAPIGAASAGLARVEVARELAGLGVGTDVFLVTVGVGDGRGDTDDVYVTLTVSVTRLRVGAVAAVTLGVEYAGFAVATLTAAGGSGEYRFSLGAVGGGGAAALEGRLSLAAGGTLWVTAGVAAEAAPGARTVTVWVRDAMFGGMAAAGEVVFDVRAALSATYGGAAAGRTTVAWDLGGAGSIPLATLTAVGGSGVGYEVRLVGGGGGGGGFALAGGELRLTAGANVGLETRVLTATVVVDDDARFTRAWTVELAAVQYARLRAAGGEVRRFFVDVTVGEVLFRLASGVTGGSGDYGYAVGAGGIPAALVGVATLVTAGAAAGEVRLMRAVDAAVAGTMEVVVADGAVLVTETAVARVTIALLAGVGGDDTYAEGFVYAAGGGGDDVLRSRGRSDLSRWEAVSSSVFAGIGRPDSGGAMANFGGRLYFSAGGSLFVSADGGTWTRVDAPWTETAGMGLAALGGRLYHFGGAAGAGGAATRAVWVSADGASWVPGAGALPAANAEFGWAVWEGALFVVGGRADGMWRTDDMVNWTPVANAPAVGAGAAAAVFNGALYVMGGAASGSAPGAVRVVRSRDGGESWVTMTLAAGTAERGGAVAVGGTLYFVAGGTVTLAADGSNLSELQHEVWGTRDGVTWTPVTVESEGGGALAGRNMRGVAVFDAAGRVPDEAAPVFAGSLSVAVTLAAAEFAGVVAGVVVSGGLGAYTYALAEGDAARWRVGADGRVWVRGANETGRTVTLTAVAAADDGHSATPPLRFGVTLVQLPRLAFGGRGAHVAYVMTNTAGTVVFDARAAVRGGSGAHRFSLVANALAANVTFDAAAGGVSVYAAFAAAVTGTVVVAAWDAAAVVPGTLEAAVEVRVIEAPSLVVRRYYDFIGTEAARVAVATVELWTVDEAPVLSMTANYPTAQVFLAAAAREILVNLPAAGTISATVRAVVADPLAATVSAVFVLTVRGADGGASPHVLAPAAEAGSVLFDRYAGAVATVRVRGGRGEYAFWVSDESAAVGVWGVTATVNGSVAVVALTQRLRAAGVVGATVAATVVVGDERDDTADARVTLSWAVVRFLAADAAVTVGAGLGGDGAVTVATMVAAGGSGNYVWRWVGAAAALSGRVTVAESGAVAVTAAVGVTGVFAATAAVRDAVLGGAAETAAVTVAVLAPLSVGVGGVAVRAVAARYDGAVATVRVGGGGGGAAVRQVGGAGGFRLTSGAAAGGTASYAGTLIFAGTNALAAAVTAAVTVRADDVLPFVRSREVGFTVVQYASLAIAGGAYRNIAYEAVGAVTVGQVLYAAAPSGGSGNYRYAVANAGGAFPAALRPYLRLTEEGAFVLTASVRAAATGVVVLEVRDLSPAVSRRVTAMVTLAFIPEPNGLGAGLEVYLPVVGVNSGNGVVAGVTLPTDYAEEVEYSIEGGAAYAVGADAFVTLLGEARRAASLALGSVRVALAADPLGTYQILPLAVNVAAPRGQGRMVVHGFGGDGLPEAWLSSDGENWGRVAQHILPLRNYGAGAYWRGYYWYAGGLLGGLGGTVTNEVWRSVDGASWKRVPQSAPMPANYGGSLLERAGRLYYVQGGGDGEVWSTADGASWSRSRAFGAAGEEGTRGPWVNSTLNYNHAALSYSNVLYVYGGAAEVGSRAGGNRLYHSLSGGRSWLERSGDAAPDLGGDAVNVRGRLVRFGEWFWILGGRQSAVGAADNAIWRSTQMDGGWVRMAETMPAATQGGAVVAHRNALYLIGGYAATISGGQVTGGAASGAVWKSGDALNWTAVATLSPLTVRALHEYVAAVSDVSGEGEVFDAEAVSVQTWLAATVYVTAGFGAVRAGVIRAAHESFGTPYPLRLELLARSDARVRVDGAAVVWEDDLSGSEDDVRVTMRAYDPTGNGLFAGVLVTASLRVVAALRSETVTLQVAHGDGASGNVDRGRGVAPVLWRNAGVAPARMAERLFVYETGFYQVNQLFNENHESFAASLAAVDAAGTRATVVLALSLRAAVRVREDFAGVAYWPAAGVLDGHEGVGRVFAFGEALASAPPDVVYDGGMSPGLARRATLDAETGVLAITAAFAGPAVEVVRMTMYDALGRRVHGDVAVLTVVVYDGVLTARVVPYWADVAVGATRTVAEVALANYDVADLSARLVAPAAFAWEVAPAAGRAVLRVAGAVAGVATVSMVFSTESPAAVTVTAVYVLTVRGGAGDEAYAPPYAVTIGGARAVTVRQNARGDVLTLRARRGAAEHLTIAAPGAAYAAFYTYAAEGMPAGWTIGTRVATVVGAGAGDYGVFEEMVLRVAGTPAAGGWTVVFSADDGSDLDAVAAGLGAEAAGLPELQRRADTAPGAATVVLSVLANVRGRASVYLARVARTETSVAVASVGAVNRAAAAVTVELIDGDGAFRLSSSYVYLVTGVTAGARTVSVRVRELAEGGSFDVVEFEVVVLQSVGGNFALLPDARTVFVEYPASVLPLTLARVTVGRDGAAVFGTGLRLDFAAEAPAWAAAALALEGNAAALAANALPAGVGAGDTVTVTLIARDRKGVNDLYDLHYTLALGLAGRLADAVITVTVDYGLAQVQPYAAGVGVPVFYELLTAGDGVTIEADGVIRVSALAFGVGLPTLVARMRSAAGTTARLEVRLALGASGDFAAVERGDVFVLGGMGGGGAGLVGEVWMLADGGGAEGDVGDWGRVWTQSDAVDVADAAMAVFGGRMYVLGGVRPAGYVLTAAAGGEADRLTRVRGTVLVTTNAVWASSDGSAWERMPDAEWSAREGHAAMVRGNALWVFGGRDADGNLPGDVWRSYDGRTWTRVGGENALGGGRARFVYGVVRGFAVAAGGAREAGAAAMVASDDMAAWVTVVAPGAVPGAAEAFFAGRGGTLFAVGGAGADGVWRYYDGAPGRGWVTVGAGAGRRLALSRGVMVGHERGVIVVGGADSSGGVNADVSRYADVVEAGGRVDAAAGNFSARAGHAGGVFDGGYESPDAAPELRVAVAITRAAGVVFPLNATLAVARVRGQDENNNVVTVTAEVVGDGGYFGTRDGGWVDLTAGATMPATLVATLRVADGRAETADVYVRFSVTVDSEVLTYARALVTHGFVNNAAGSVRLGLAGGVAPYSVNFVTVAPAAAGVAFSMFANGDVYYDGTWTVGAGTEVTLGLRAVDALGRQARMTLVAPLVVPLVRRGVRVFVTVNRTGHVVDIPAYFEERNRENLRVESVEVPRQLRRFIPGDFDALWPWLLDRESGRLSLRYSYDRGLSGVITAVVRDVRGGLEEDRATLAISVWVFEGGAPGATALVNWDGMRVGASRRLADVVVYNIADVSLAAGQNFPAGVSLSPFPRDEFALRDLRSGGTVNAIQRLKRASELGVLFWAASITQAAAGEYDVTVRMAGVNSEGNVVSMTVEWAFTVYADPDYLPPYEIQAGVLEAGAIVATIGTGTGVVSITMKDSYRGHLATIYADQGARLLKYLRDFRQSFYAYYEYFVTDDDSGVWRMSEDGNGWPPEDGGVAILERGHLRAVSQPDVGVHTVRIVVRDGGADGPSFLWSEPTRPRYQRRDDTADVTVTVVVVVEAELLLNVVQYLEAAPVLGAGSSVAVASLTAANYDFSSLTVEFAVGGDEFLVDDEGVVWLTATVSEGLLAVQATVYPMDEPGRFSVVQLGVQVVANSDDLGRIYVFGVDMPTDYLNFPDFGFFPPQRNMLWVSSDGENWSRFDNILPTDRVLGARGIYRGRLFYVGGYTNYRKSGQVSGAVNLVSYSDDGVVWREQEAVGLPAGGGELLAHRGTLFFISDEKNFKVYRSLDGLNWTYTGNAGEDYAGLRKAVMSDGVTMWVLGGSNENGVVPDQNNPNNEDAERVDAFMVSEDGVNWTKSGGNIPSFGEDVGILFYGRMVYLAGESDPYRIFGGETQGYNYFITVVESSGSTVVLRNNDPATEDVWQSADGGSWSNGGSTIPHASRFGGVVLHKGDLYLVGGEELLADEDRSNALPVSNTRREVWRSADGDNWTEVVKGVNAPFAYAQYEDDEGKYFHRVAVVSDMPGTPNMADDNPFDAFALAEGRRSVTVTGLTAGGTVRVALATMRVTNNYFEYPHIRAAIAGTADARVRTEGAVVWLAGVMEAAAITLAATLAVADASPNNRFDDLRYTVHVVAAPALRGRTVSVFLESGRATAAAARAPGGLPPVVYRQVSVAPVFMADRVSVDAEGVLGTRTLTVGGDAMRWTVYAEARDAAGMTASVRVDGLLYPPLRLRAFARRVVALTGAVGWTVLAVDEALAGGSGDYVIEEAVIPAALAGRGVVLDAGAGEIRLGAGRSIDVPLTAVVTARLRDAAHYVVDVHEVVMTVVVATAFLAARLEAEWPDMRADDTRLMAVAEVAYAGRADQVTVSLMYPTVFMSVRATVGQGGALRYEFLAIAPRVGTLFLTLAAYSDVPVPRWVTVSLALPVYAGADYDAPYELGAALSVVQPLVDVRYRGVVGRISVARGSGAFVFDGLDLPAGFVVTVEAAEARVAWLRVAETPAAGLATLRVRVRDVRPDVVETMAAMTVTVALALEASVHVLLPAVHAGAAASVVASVETRFVFGGATMSLTGGEDIFGLEADSGRISLLSDVESADAGVYVGEVVVWDENPVGQTLAVRFVVEVLAGSGGNVRRGRMYIYGLGGAAGGGVNNEIWIGGDGMRWGEYQNYVLPGRNYGAGAYWDGALWYVGGRLAGGAETGEVWRSFDGVNWRRVSETALPANAGGSLVEHADGLLYVGGGTLAGVWRSADGMAWTRAAAAADLPWVSGGVQNYGHAVLSHGGTVWLYGGGRELQGDGGRANSADMYYSTDGAVWRHASQLVTAAGGWAAPTEGGVANVRGRLVRFLGKFWVMGGQQTVGMVTLVGSSAVWSSFDMVHWTREAGAALPYAQPFGRVEYYRNGGVVLHRGALYMVGGESGNSQRSDSVWRSTDGLQWSEVPQRSGARVGIAGNDEVEYMVLVSDRPEAVEVNPYAVTLARSSVAVRFRHYGGVVALATAMAVGPLGEYAVALATAAGSDARVTAMGAVAALSVRGGEVVELTATLLASDPTGNGLFADLPFVVAASLAPGLVPSEVAVTVTSGFPTTLALAALGGVAPFVFSLTAVAPAAAVDGVSVRSDGVAVLVGDYFEGPFDARVRVLDGRGDGADILVRVRVLPGIALNEAAALTVAVRAGVAGVGDTIFEVGRDVVFFGRTVSVRVAGGGGLGGRLGVTVTAAPAGRAGREVVAVTAAFAVGDSGWVTLELVERRNVAAVSLLLTAVAAETPLLAVRRYWEDVAVGAVRDVAALELFAESVAVPIADARVVDVNAGYAGSVRVRAADGGFVVAVADVTGGVVTAVLEADVQGWRGAAVSAVLTLTVVDDADYVAPYVIVPTVRGEGRTAALWYRGAVATVSAVGGGGDYRYAGVDLPRWLTVNASSGVVALVDRAANGVGVWVSARVLVSDGRADTADATVVAAVTLAAPRAWLRVALPTVAANVTWWVAEVQYDWRPPDAALFVTEGGADGFGLAGEWVVLEAGARGRLAAAEVRSRSWLAGWYADMALTVEVDGRFPGVIAPMPRTVTAAVSPYAVDAAGRVMAGVLTVTAAVVDYPVAAATAAGTDGRFGVVNGNVLVFGGVAGGGEVVRATVTARDATPNAFFAGVTQVAVVRLPEVLQNQTVALTVGVSVGTVFVHQSGSGFGRISYLYYDAAPLAMAALVNVGVDGQVEFFGAGEASRFTAFVLMADAGRVATLEIRFEVVEGAGGGGGRGMTFGRGGVFGGGADVAVVGGGWGGSGRGGGVGAGWALFEARRRGGVGVFDGVI